MLQDERAIGALNKLIQLDYDAAQAYERAISRIENDGIRRELQSFKRDHERHIVTLSDCVRDLGGVPIELRRDVKGMLLEGLTVVRSIAGIEGALKAIRTNEEITNVVYDEASRVSMPPGVRDVVEQNRDDEHRHLSYIQRVIAQITWSRRAPRPPERPSSPRM